MQKKKKTKKQKKVHVVLRSDNHFSSQINFKSYMTTLTCGTGARSQVVAVCPTGTAWHHTGIGHSTHVVLNLTAVSTVAR